MKKGVSVAAANRAIRQEAVRDQIASYGLVQQVHEVAIKLADLEKDMDPIHVARLKAANDARLALIKKYLPDLKQTELVGPDGGPVVQRVERVLVRPSPENTDR